MDSDTAYSLQSAKCIVLKMGCDKVAGSNLERDKCGVCRRDKRNKCVGCDGQAYSNKRWGEVLNSIFQYTGLAKAKSGALKGYFKQYLPEVVPLLS